MAVAVLPRVVVDISAVGRSAPGAAAAPLVSHIKRVAVVAAIIGVLLFSLTQRSKKKKNRWGGDGANKKKRTVGALLGAEASFF